MTLSEHEELTGKDASWILTTSVIIFTMQTGERKHATEVAKLCIWNSHLSPKRIKSPKMWLIWIFLQSFETVKETSGGHVFTELIGPQLHLEYN